jgi:hypothetical protein
MAGVIVVLVVITVAAGFCIGLFIRLSLAIRWEDHRKGSLRFDAPSASTRAARSLVGVSQSGWDA